MFLTGYRCMWVVAMFDLPTKTKEARHEYTVFLKNLKKNGFSRLQFSVYARHCASKESAEVHVKRIESFLPPEGEVRVLAVTDKQFERMIVFWQKKVRPTESAPCQMLLF